MRTTRFTAALAAAIITVAPTLHAQQTTDPVAPRSGTWGAEAGYGANGQSASLLRFSSPTSAWLAGASFTAIRETRDVLTFPGGTTNETDFFGGLSARLGRRWWSGGSSERLRPLRGVGLVGSVNNQSNYHSWTAGGYGELGATYFFTPHFSLGAAGEVLLSYGHDRFAVDVAGVPDRVNTRWFARGNLVTVNAGVYF